jgi:uncharacterized RDD family membrane protein YckC
MTAEAMPGEAPVEYVGFWLRFVAFLIDSFVMAVVMIPLLAAVYGWTYFESQPSGQRAGFAGPWDVIVQVVLPAVAAILFWRYKGATPGKMVVSAKIVDAGTGQAPTTRQLVIRYFAYFVSVITLFVGFAWIGIDRRKQGFHDKIAGTLVVKDKEEK